MPRNGRPPINCRQAYLLLFAASLLRGSRACVIDQNAAHGLGGDGKEMSPVLIRHGLVSEEPDAQFIHERIRLQGMICSLVLQQTHRYLTQLNMDGFEQSLASGLIAATPEHKPSRDLLRVWHTSLNGLKMRPESDSFRYYRWDFCVFAA